MTGQESLGGRFVDEAVHVHLAVVNGEAAHRGTPCPYELAPQPTRRSALEDLDGPGLLAHGGRHPLDVRSTSGRPDTEC